MKTELVLDTNVVSYLYKGGALGAGYLDLIGNRSASMTYLWKASPTCAYSPLHREWRVRDEPVFGTTSMPTPLTPEEVAKAEAEFAIEFPALVARLRAQAAAGAAAASALECAMIPSTLSGRPSCAPLAAPAQ